MGVTFPDCSKARLAVSQLQLSTVFGSLVRKLSGCYCR